jgi:hypothetical protein
MFAGHVGAALATGRAEPEINVGIFVFAALLLVVLLWILVLLGWESVTIPADFASTHQAEYVFPWSHGLLAFTVAGMTVAPPPPSVQAMAGASLATLSVVRALTCWLGGRA